MRSEPDWWCRTASYMGFSTQARPWADRPICGDQRITRRWSFLQVNTTASQIVTFCLLYSYHTKSHKPITWCYRPLVIPWKANTTDQIAGMGLVISHSQPCPWCTSDGKSIDYRHPSDVLSPSDKPSDDPLGGYNGGQSITCIRALPCELEHLSAYGYLGRLVYPRTCQIHTHRIPIVRINENNVYFILSYFFFLFLFSLRQSYDS